MTFVRVLYLLELPFDHRLLTVLDDDIRYLDHLDHDVDSVVNGKYLVYVLLQLLRVFLQQLNVLGSVLLVANSIFVLHGLVVLERLEHLFLRGLEVLEQRRLVVFER